jgi:hypothetical protein
VLVCLEEVPKPKTEDEKREKREVRGVRYVLESVTGRPTCTQEHIIFFNVVRKTMEFSASQKDRRKVSSTPRVVGKSVGVA